MTTATITFIESITTDDVRARHILNLETCISVVATFFYSKFVEQIEEGVDYKQINIDRYTDWMITTPLMLLVLCLVFVYNFNGYSLNFISTLTTLIWIIVFIGVSNQYFNRNYKIVKYLIEISYPVYLIHLIPAIIFGTKLFEMDYNSSEIMLPNILVSGIVSIFSYILFVKYTPINWFINGYNKSWFQPFKK